MVGNKIELQRVRVGLQVGDRGRSHITWKLGGLHSLGQWGCVRAFC